MESFCIQFGLDEAKLQALLESVVGEKLSDVTVAVSAADENNADTQLVTFRYALQNRAAGDVTLFVKKCVWECRSESVHYRYLAANHIPTPRLYGAVQNAAGIEVIFLEPIASAGFRDSSLAEWREMLSLLARFNACPVTPEYAAHLLPYAQVGQIAANVWALYLPAQPNVPQIETDLRAAGVPELELPGLIQVALGLFAQADSQSRGLLHQDFHPGNFGWRGSPAEALVFDLHKNSFGPRFADVAPYLASPYWFGQDQSVDVVSIHRMALIQHYLDEYARFAGAQVPLETFQAETAVLFWVHQITVLQTLLERKQEASVQAVLRFLEQSSETELSE